jgi:hypothetical protein
MHPIRLKRLRDMVRSEDDRAAADQPPAARGALAAVGMAPGQAALWARSDS